jgi:uracil-DNA glycosylase
MESVQSNLLGQNDAPKDKSNTLQSVAPVPLLPRLRLKVIQPIEQSWSIRRIIADNCPLTWEAVMAEAKHELNELSDDLDRYEREGGPYFPMKKDIFRALELTPLPQVRVVILGQDPYPHVNASNGQPGAVGLSFSVARNDKITSSLRNIFQELATTVEDFVMPRHGDLTSWTRQGVLLLNSCLTVWPNSPGSHGDIWKGVVGKILSAISNLRPGTIFVLWGNIAQSFQRELGDRAIILTAPHPSGKNNSNRNAKGGGFLGCNHFNQINQHLIKRGETPINWNLD